MSEELALELQQRSWELQAQGQLAQAADAAREAVRLMEQCSGADSPDVANLLADLSEVEHLRGESVTALALIARARSIVDALGQRFEGADAARIRLRSLSIAGTIQRSVGDYSQAEPQFEQALHLAADAFGETSEELAVARNDMAVLYKLLGRYDAAEQLYRHALATMISIYGEDSLACGTLYHNIGGLLHARGDYAAAEGPARRAWDISRREIGEDDLRAVLDAVAYGAVLEGLTRYDECEEIYLAALPRLERLLGEHHQEIAALVHNLAAVLEARGAVDRAEELYRRSLAMRERLLGSSHPDVALTLNNLGVLLLDCGRREEGIHLLESAVSRLRALGQDHPHYMKARSHLVRARKCP